MEEIEPPTEKILDEIGERAERALERWVSWVALSAAILAALAAVTSLLAGDHANEAMVDQIQSSDQWSFYQAKGIKAEVLRLRLELQQSQGHEPPADQLERLQRYDREQQEISDTAREKEQAASAHLRHHVIYARGVTMFQIAITIAAMSVLTKRRGFWYVGLGFGALGMASLLQGLFSA